MSLFYGYTPPDTVTKEQLRAELDRELKRHTKASRTLFDLNVARASGSARIDSSGLVEYIEDNEGDTRSVMFGGSGTNPVLLTAGRHHFLLPLAHTATLYANVPGFMNPDVSVFVVVKRNSVRPATKVNIWEVIVSNDDGGWDKALGFKAGVDDKLVFGGSSPVKDNECTIPAEFIGEKKLVSIHWLSGPGESHVRVNGEKLTDSVFTCNNERTGKPYLGVFALNHRKKFYADISFYGMKIVSGHERDAEIGEISDEMKTEHVL